MEHKETSRALGYCCFHEVPIGSSLILNWCYLLTFLVSLPALLPGHGTRAQPCPSQSHSPTGRKQRRLLQKPLPKCLRDSCTGSREQPKAQSSSSVPWATSTEAISKQHLESGGHLPMQDISGV